MKIPLSRRLAACCGFVAPGDRVADIGCDHGYLGIYLLQCGIASSVVASDVREGPLESARRNGEKFGVTDKISFFLSDGAENIPRDFDCLVCAGMGADTMIHILSAAPWLRSSQYRLVLQCQSKTPSLRRYLSENGWRIAEESVLRDGKFLYTVMEVWYQPEYPRLTPGEWYFPPAIMENPSRETMEYYRRTVERLRLAAAHQPENGTLCRALTELSEHQPQVQVGGNDRCQGEGDADGHEIQEAHTGI